MTTVADVTPQEQRILSERRIDTFAAADRLWRIERGDDDDAEVRMLEHVVLLRAMAWAAEADAIAVALREREGKPTQLPVQHRPLPPGVPVVDIDDPDTYPDGFRAV